MKQGFSHILLIVARTVNSSHLGIKGGVEWLELGSLSLEPLLVYLAMY